MNKSLKIGNLEASIPIVQGGMGIGVSLSSLSSSVANEGGIGIISAAQIGFNEKDFETNNYEANIRALRKEVRNAKKLSPYGIIGINMLVAGKNYSELVKTAVEEKIDIIVSGAGLPLDLPEFVINSNTKIAPIVSSSKAALLICRMWDKRYNKIPDMIVVEGPLAGGHLGFKLDELKLNPPLLLEDIVDDVLKAIVPYEEKYDKKIPVVAAGGIYTKDDVEKFIQLGASGVQMATRFVATFECDADIKYKEAYVNSCEEDIVIIKSPVGLPGRAIRNNFIDKILCEKQNINKCYNCLKTCIPTQSPYCISKALISAVKGDVNNGLIFTGANAHKINKIVSVKELINEII